MIGDIIGDIVGDIKGCRTSLVAQLPLTDLQIVGTPVVSIAPIADSQFEKLGPFEFEVILSENINPREGWGEGMPDQYVYIIRYIQE